MLNVKLKTAESVTEGHPDKTCDQISDAILDACLAQDPNSKVAVETVGGHGKLYLVGEITTQAKVDYEKIARRVYKEIGYDDQIKVITNIVQQSPDIARLVEDGGAGDQGIMYGYATNESPDYLPLALSLAHKITKELTQLRKTPAGRKILMPDGKSQVTINNGQVSKVVISVQHRPEVDLPTLRKYLQKTVIKKLFKNYKNVEFYLNQVGEFHLGGIYADTGLTGRKIMVDTYGGSVPHGGGAFSGKDPSKVDRSAAYMARYLAKNIVAQGKCNRCLVSISYVIGKAEPLMVETWTDTGKNYVNWINQNFDLRPAGIIKFLDLKKPIYYQTAKNGHFGNPKFPWEKIKKI